MAFTDDFVMTVEEGGAVVGEAAAPDDEDDEMLDVFFGLPASGSIRPIGTHAPGECARPQPRLSFASLKLSRPLLKAVESAGFDEPTRVQELAIPVIMSGGDVCATAITGSGKTAAFMLPVLERLLVRTRRSASTAALVLLPTRELGMQCHAMTSRLAKYTSVQTALVVGGLSLKAQEAELRSRPDIVIGTPGRLIDLVRNSQAVTLESVEVLVLDEADRLLELGFRAELDEIIKMTPRGRQTLLFTATLSPAVEQLIAASLNRPTTVKVNEDMGVAGTLVQEFVRVHSDAPGGTAQPFGGVVLGEHLAQAEREAALLSLCTRSFTEGVLVFTRSRTQAHRLATLMRACELKAGELHGELSQQQRVEELERFRRGDSRFLIATDLASRGLDITGVQTVINFQMPATIRSYIHRVGRTARAGRGGRAISLVSGSDKTVLEEVVQRAPHAVKTRVLPDGSIEAWGAQILALQPVLRATYAREKEDKQMRVAQMEANRASNLLQHREEIRTRPRRTWFLSKAGKAEQQAKAQRDEPTSVRAVHATRPPKGGAASAQSADGPAGRAREPDRQLTRKQKRKREAAKQLAAQSGLDEGAVLHQAKRAAKAAKSLAKQSPRATADRLRASAKAASPFQSPKPKRPRADKPRADAASAGVAQVEGGRTAKPTKPFRRSNHSKQSHIKRRR